MRPPQFTLTATEVQQLFAQWLAPVVGPWPDEGLAQGFVGDVDLLVDGLAADVEIVRQVRNGLRPGQRLQRQLLALAGR